MPNLVQSSEKSNSVFSPTEPPEYFTITEAAEILRIKRQTFTDQIRKGLVPVVKIERTIRIPREFVYPFRYATTEKMTRRLKESE